MVFQEHPAELLHKPEQPLYHRFAGIFNGCRHGYIVNIFLFGLCGHGKCRIGKTKTERIQYFLFCKGLKVAVST